MSRLPQVTGQEVVRALTRAGFLLERQRGSHHFMRHPDGRSTVVPVHRGDDLGRGILSKILQDTEMSREEFRRLLRE
jgi:predicted RNA binding protein YcfA (HicA-like mRNA interferase family)